MEDNEVQNYHAELKSMTGGECTYTVEFDHYDIVPPHVQKAIMEKFEKDQGQK